MAINVWDPSQAHAAITFANLDQVAEHTGLGGPHSVIALSSHSDGFKYFEIVPSSTTGAADVSSTYIGVSEQLPGIFLAPGQTSPDWGTSWFSRGDGNSPFRFVLGGGGVAVAGYLEGDVIGVGVDFDNDVVLFYNNGAFVYSEPMPDGLTLFPAVGFESESQGFLRVADAATVAIEGTTETPIQFLPVGAAAWQSAPLAGTIFNCDNDISRYVRAYDWNTNALIDSTTIDMTVTQDYVLNVPPSTDYFLVSTPVDFSLIAAGRKILTAGPFTT